jgi:hypothetical protein
LQELLEDVKKEVVELSWRGRCFLVALRISLNVFIGLVLAGTGLVIWFILHEEMGVTAERSATVVMPVIITVIMIATPALFSWMAR